MSELQLAVAPVVEAELELVDAELVPGAEAVARASRLSPLSPSPPPIPPTLAERNLFGEAERVAARAASASTRRQYGAIFRAFGDWLAGELGRGDRMVAVPERDHADPVSPRLRAQVGPPGLQVDALGEITCPRCNSSPWSSPGRLG